MKFTQATKQGLLRKLTSENWEIAEEFIWYLNYESKDTYVIVPQGFVTNFGSIPRLLRAIFTPTRYLGYVLHDALYTKNIYIIYQDENETQSIVPSRKQADQIMREALKVEGAGFIERNLIYLGVRIGGFNHYVR